MKYLVVNVFWLDRNSKAGWTVMTLAVVGAFKMKEPTDGDQRWHGPSVFVQAWDAGARSCIISLNTDKKFDGAPDRPSHPTVRWYVKTPIEVINSHLDAHYLLED